MKIIQPLSTLLKISILTNIIEGIGKTDNVFKAFKFLSDNFDAPALKVEKANIKTLLEVHYLRMTFC